MPRLEHWSLVGPSGIPADRLEPHSQSLRGTVYGHPFHTDGKPVRTSEIVSIARRNVTTKTGQVYELGDPDPAYLGWLGKRPLPLAPSLTLVPSPDVDDVEMRP
jgi:hypothetical protein